MLVTIDLAIRWTAQPFLQSQLVNLVRVSAMDKLVLVAARNIQIGKSHISSMSSKPIDIRWIRNGSKPHWKIMYSIELQTIKLKTIKLILLGANETSSLY